MIKKNSKVFVTGHKGLVGSSILKTLKKKGFKNIITADRKQLNLLDKNKVNYFIKSKKVEYIINCAAKVGGILANSIKPVEFFYENIQMQNNLLLSAHKYKIKRFVFLGSSCIYPRNSLTPIRENQLLSGKLEKTNEAYAIAKISGVKLSEFLFNQYKMDIICVMPTNLYGVNDNFDKYTSHVIPAMIAKFNDAKKKNKKSVELFGTGKPLREFLYNDDLSEAIFMLLKLSKNKIMNKCINNFPIFNIGTGRNISIKNLANLISKKINYKGRIIFNSYYPDGTKKKDLNSQKIRSLGWKPKIKLEKGIDIILKKKFNV